MCIPLSHILRRILCLGAGGDRDDNDNEDAAPPPPPLAATLPPEALVRSLLAERATVAAALPPEALVLSLLAERRGMRLPPEALVASLLSQPRADDRQPMPIRPPPHSVQSQRAPAAFRLLWVRYGEATPAWTGR
ncbi:hypothetical protein Q8F55_002922 [Vanrija albida]|uniref:Uncharacterized protein n=1 Tax=Vanrija albida TaxID=181172 RepID=A0ABR3QC51_9TREE